MRSALLLALLLLPPLACASVTESASAPQDDASRVSLDRLFAGKEFAPTTYGPVRWLEDGSGYTTLEDSPAGPGRDLVLYDPQTGARQVLVPAARLVPASTGADVDAGASAEPLEVEDYAWSAERRKLLVFTNTRKVWRQNTRGDYWVLDLDGGSLRRLGEDFAEATLMFAKFSPQGDRVAFVQAGDLWVEDLGSGALTRLTSDGSDTVTNGTFDWVYEEEFGLQDGFRWSPDGERIAYWRIDSEGVGLFHLIDNAAGPYPRLVPIRYPKVGTANSECRVGVVPAEGGQTRWVELEGDSRQEYYLARMEWAASSDELVIQRLNRRQDSLDVLLADAGSGVARTILSEQDDAWLDAVDDLAWIADGAAFLWVSERGGWRGLYRVPREGGEWTALTPGAYDVVSVVGVGPDEQHVYFIASPQEPAMRFLYRVPLDGSGTLERLTPIGESGTHAYQMSPDARWAIHTRSAFERPPLVDLVRLPGHAVARLLEDDAELVERYRALARAPVEFFRVPVGEGDERVELDGWCMKPPDFTPRRRWPVLFFVYGEPWGQTVADRWGGERYLWHLMLTQLGYVVISVDNRGTPSPRGRDWRKCAFGRIGGMTSREQADAVRGLEARWAWIDPERVAIWGWSGGGSSTLQAMFRYPDLYAVGMSVAPVPDQRLYDTIYQERYTGLLDEQPENYARNSPITHAHGLQGELLIVHGTGDDNVHYQGTERLIDTLIAAGKPFSMMAYPMRSHSIDEGVGTRRHLYGLLTRFLTEKLPAGGR